MGHVPVVLAGAREATEVRRELTCERGSGGTTFPKGGPHWEAVDPKREESLGLPLPAASTALPYQARRQTAQGSPQERLTPQAEPGGCGRSVTSWPVRGGSRWDRQR